MLDKCVLSDLKIGQKAKIKSIDITDKEIKRHLLDMGLTRGTVIQIIKIPPMGDPIDIKLRNYELAIRKNDLKHISGEVVD